MVIGFVVIHERNGRHPPGTLGQRLLAHSQDRDDYLLFVGMPPDNPRTWIKVTQIDSGGVTLSDSQTLDLAAVTAYFVAYPSRALVELRGSNKLRLPGWVTSPVESSEPDRDVLTLEDLEEGRSLVQIRFGPSRSHPESIHHYSTTLKNISDKRVRVLKFGGYKKTGYQYALSNNTNIFFTPADFKDWYHQKGDWIEPGQELTDWNNYGTPPCLWAYYCESENGQKFIAGGIIG